MAAFKFSTVQVERFFASLAIVIPCLLAKSTAFFRAVLCVIGSAQSNVATNNNKIVNKFLNLISLWFLY